MNSNLFACASRGYQSLKFALTCALLSAFVACGGGGTTPVTGLSTPGAIPATTVLLMSTAAVDATSLSSLDGATTSLAVDPSTGQGTVVKVVSPTSTSSTAGAAIALVAGQSIPFTASAQTLTLRVWSAAAGIPVRLRVENSSGLAASVDAQADRTTVKGWQTLTFDFSKPIGAVTTATAVAIAPDSRLNTPVSRSLASISPVFVDLTKAYNKISVFFNYGKNVLTGETYYFSNLHFSTPGSSALRPLGPEFLARKAVNYSPYRDSLKNEDRPNEDVTDDEVFQDLLLLEKAGFGLIRLFDSNEKVAQRVLRVIDSKKLDIKVYLGMWMAGYDDAGNKDQMAYGVALVKSYPDIVVAVSVGNESLVQWDQPYRMKPEILAANIKTVRDQITLPVTTDDNWAYYANADRVVLDTIDFAAVHTYAMVDTHYNPTFWDWKQLGETNLNKRAVAMMDAAILATKSDYNKARAFLDSKGHSAMPIVIGETGWMAVNPKNKWYTFLAHPVNQKLYFDRLTAWANEGKTGAGPKNVFYFEAFDEPWKGDDDGWGLFTVDRKARCTAQSLNPAATWTAAVGSCDAATALYFKPPTLNLAVADAKLVIHSEAITGWPVGTRADGYEANTYNLQYPAVGDSSAGDMAAAPGSSNYIKLSAFTPKDYGWGLLWQSNAELPVPPVTANMVNFANGSIRFSVKTSYVGKLRVGISSDTELDGPVEANVLVSSANYGYCTGTPTVWCDVSIPLAAFKTANPKLDLQYVLTRFSIADIYSETGNTARTGMPEIRLDNIYWAK
jgi:exo-beta-1,3-glucanase (GH17 family)